MVFLNFMEVPEEIMEVQEEAVNRKLSNFFDILPTSTDRDGKVLVKLVLSFLHLKPIFLHILKCHYLLVKFMILT